MQKLQLSIPEPCHENWQQMTPTEQGRFCKACAKEVIDFSTMTDMQVLKYFTNLTHEKVCGRALPEQLDRTIIRPEPPKKKLFWYWNYVVMFFMFFKGNNVAAQSATKPATEASPVKNMDVRGEVVTVGGIKRDVSRVVTGKVTDENGNAVPFAAVRIKGTPTGVITDANGVYSLRIKPDAILEIYNAGFKSVEIVTDSQSVFTTVLEKANTFLEGAIVLVQKRDPDEYYGSLDKSKRVAVIRVKDEATGKPIPNANLIIESDYKESVDTVLTDKKGMYKIKRIKDGDEYAIKISVEGYEPNEFTIDEYDFKNRKKEWEVLLRKKSDVVRSTATPETCKPTVIRMGAIQEVPANNGPLYVVDGIIIPKDTAINPDDVEDYSILQGPAAAALFGLDGSNGAIVITTRKAKEIKMKEVVVTSEFGSRRTIRGAMSGSITIINQNSYLSEKVITIKTILSDSVKVYPNPVQRNSSFSVKLKLKQSGNGYTYMITDASGKILLQRKFNAVAKEHTEKITAGNRWAAGIYYIRIFDTHNKLISKSSFVFQ